MNEEIIEIIKKVSPYIIPEKLECFKSILIKQALDDNDILFDYIKAADSIKELGESDTSEFTKNFLRGLFYSKKTTLALMCVIVASFSKKGIEFLECLGQKISLNKKQKETLEEFRNEIKRTNELIDLGYNFLEAENITKFPLHLLTIDDNEKIPLIKDATNKAEGISSGGEEVLYEEITNPENNKKFFLAFFIKNSSYLRYIGEVGNKLTFVTNEKGTFKEVQEKTFQISPCTEDEENEILKQNPYFMPKCNKKAKHLEINQEFTVSVMDEIKELKSFDGSSYVLESLLDDGIKKYQLK